VGLKGAGQRFEVKALGDRLKGVAQWEVKKGSWVVASPPAVASQGGEEAF
jgi:hypothetical protein